MFENKIQVLILGETEPKTVNVIGFMRKDDFDVIIFDSDLPVSPDYPDRNKIELRHLDWVIDLDTGIKYSGPASFLRDLKIIVSDEIVSDVSANAEGSALAALSLDSGDIIDIDIEDDSTEVIPEAAKLDLDVQPKDISIKPAQRGRKAK